MRQPWSPSIAESPLARDFPEWLVDNADAYDRILQSIESAQRSIWITQLAFDADCVAHSRTSAPHAGSSAHGRHTVLAESLLAAVARAPVDVRILLNATLLLDTARPLRNYFDTRLESLHATRGTIRLRGISLFPQLLHAKMILVDGQHAFLLGSPFVNGYWDDARHAPVDTRRPGRELGGRPVHDVSVVLDGPPVLALEQIFAELWGCAAARDVASADRRVALTDKRIARALRRAFWGATQVLHRAASATLDVVRGLKRTPRTAAMPVGRSGFNRIAGGRSSASVRDQPASRSGVCIASTWPRRVLPGCADGCTQIMDELLQGIASARSLIYIEHQYLSARPVAAALVDALDRHPALELIVVLNQNPDVTAYRRWQNARLAESGLLTHARAGVFALWSAAHGRGSRPATLNQVFVHSKIVVVDDTWVTAGSANLDGVSLHSYGDDFTGILARRVFRHVRNFDVNVVLRERPDWESASERSGVVNLRARLWSEHLDAPVSALTERPAEGWLPLWRARAAANVAALISASGNNHADAQMRGFVLPYSVQPTPAKQLADLGVRVDPARLEVSFRPGWLEVHFSPSWVRNMFS